VIFLTILAWKRSTGRAPEHPYYKVKVLTPSVLGFSPPHTRLPVKLVIKTTAIIKHRILLLLSE
jgi:hypothetical protein